MIRSGRREGWFSLEPVDYVRWASHHGVDFRCVQPGKVPGRGVALLASESLAAAGLREEMSPLMTVPSQLILDLEHVQQHARTDRDFREVLGSLDGFGREARGAILSFLIFQASMSNPRLEEAFGVHSPHLLYVQSLPFEMLPTFWNQSELQLLIGTTLAPAIASKLQSLHREFDLVVSSTSKTRWWNIVQGQIDFEDWLEVDAMYRSRALDFPNIGHCMVPCLDLANHASGEATTALYDVDARGDATLLLRPDKEVAKGSEVTITYGDEKGACEMLFSYGFLEHDRVSAESLFLSLTLPDDDVYRQAKMKIASAAPGFRLADAGDGRVDWEGDFVWLLCADQDDGLRFELAQTIEDGSTEVHGLFQGQTLVGGAAGLHRLLRSSELWDVYRLRATTIIQERIFEQMKVLHETQELVESVPHGDGHLVRDKPFALAIQLRSLEFELLDRAFEQLETTKIELADTEVVKKYLAAMQYEQEQQVEDFA